MSTDFPQFLNRRKLHHSLKQGLTEAWNELRSLYPDDEVYGFGFFVYELSSIGTVAFSTEGLRKVATEHMERATGRGDTRELSDHELELRWSPADSPLHEIGSAQLADADMMIKKVSKAIDARFEGNYDHSEEHVKKAIATTRQVMVAVLNELRADNLFMGCSITLGIWAGDQSDEERLEFVKSCNPKKTAHRFDSEQKASLAAYFARIKK